MKTTALVIILLASCCLAQSTKHLTAVSPFDTVVQSGVKVDFSYAIPADDPIFNNAAMFTAQTPVHIQWHWGDEAENAHHKNFSEGNYASVNKATHVYKPGTYTMFVTVTDTKGRLVIQDLVKIKVSLPVEFDPVTR